MTWLTLLVHTVYIAIRCTSSVAADEQPQNRLLLLSTVDEYLNLCLDGENHKDVPGPEDAMHAECSPYRERSCCTPAISKSLQQNDTWYNFRLDHCARLSKPCKRHFDKDLCFYECSADVGPWLVQDSPRKWRRERFYQVPLCQSECEQWFSDCRDDLTCVVNWATQFKWKNGQMACPTGSECRTFTEVFRNATNFCENVWDGSYKVVNDNQPCMKLWFDARSNPNAAVALARARELVAASSAEKRSMDCIVFMGAVSYAFLAVLPAFAARL